MSEKVFQMKKGKKSKTKSYIEVNGNRLLLTFRKYEVKTIVYENGDLSESYELLI